MNSKSVFLLFPYFKWKRLIEIFNNQFNWLFNVKNSSKKEVKIHQDSIAILIMEMKRKKTPF